VKALRTGCNSWIRASDLVTTSTELTSPARMSSAVCHASAG
jgi:hypothetical protein